MSLAQNSIWPCWQFCCMNMSCIGTICSCVGTIHPAGGSKELRSTQKHDQEAEPSAHMRVSKLSAEQACSRGWRSWIVGNSMPESKKVDNNECFDPHPLSFCVTQNHLHDQGCQRPDVTDNDADGQ